MKVKKRMLITLDNEEKEAIMTTDLIISALMENYKVKCNDLFCEECPLRQLCTKLAVFRNKE